MNQTELHAELFAAELNLRVESIDDPFRDTFNCVFDLPVFREWLQEGSGLFWIHGKPGSGKSTFMKLIFQHRQTWELLHNWQQNSLEIMAGFFFHYRGTAIQKSFEGVLRSLILQVLATVRDPYRKRHEPTWRKYESAKKRLSQQTRKLVQARRLLSNTTQALMKLEEELLRLHATQQNVQHPSADVAHQIVIHESRQKSLFAGESQHHAEVKRVEGEIEAITLDLVALEKKQRSFEAAPETRFLKEVATSFRIHRDSDGLVQRLERLLKQLLDQTMMDLDVVLFFDALDEFDGHLDMICRFIKTLLRNSTASKTRVKVCMSSRP